MGDIVGILIGFGVGAFCILVQLVRGFSCQVLSSARFANNLQYSQYYVIRICYNIYFVCYIHSFDIRRHLGLHAPL